MTSLAAEKALVNLSNPLLVSDELQTRLGSHASRNIIVAAGLHRQTWISGYLLFVDVHIDNKSTRDVKKLELQLEKTTTFHDFSAPSTSKGSADQLRLPDRMEKEVVARKEVTDGFRGVRGSTQDFRTCQIEIPTGLVSVETGMFDLFPIQCVFTYTLSM